MKIGITGHQRRPGLDWAWTERSLREQLELALRPVVGLTSLALGADQLFARLVLEVGGTLHAVIPLKGYERFFDGPGLAGYLDLRRRAFPIQLNGAGPTEEAFFAAGRYIADHCDVLFAVWDGEEAAGLGGTADVVHYALGQGRPVVHLDPIQQKALRLGERAG